MDKDKPVFVYADLETDNLRGDLLLQISAFTSDNSFSVYINPHKELPKDCTQITGLSFTKGSLYKNGKLLFPLQIHNALRLFNKFLQQLGKNVHLVFHNAFGFDARVLLKHYSRQKIDLPSNVVLIHDSLPALRKKIKSDEAYEKSITDFKLSSIGKFLGIQIEDLHNAYSDSILLKLICESYSTKLGITVEQLLDQYHKPPSFFINKQTTRK